MNTKSADEHAFVKFPHRTLIFLSFPVLLSLIAEPVTGLVDTAFIARLGSESLAALGVGTMALSSIFWIFNFLAIGTQTEVAQATGSLSPSRAARMGTLAFGLGLIFGLLLAIIGYPAADPAARLLGATGTIAVQAQGYIRIRLFGAPAVLAIIAAFGSMRGIQDMRTPLLVASGINLLNILLDAVLIYGWGPIPAFGISGAAAASSVSWWAGALMAAIAVRGRLGLPDRIPIGEAKRLLRVGGELFVRTGLLILFLLLATRAATRIGADAGAAHQAIRQVWVFTNLFLDAFAITGQSLVGYFIGSGRVAEARRVAGVVCIWSAATGGALTLIMWYGRNLAIAAFVPQAAVQIFLPAWLVAAAAQPLSALSFATDGIHWGTGDFRYLRNAVAVATGCGAAALMLLDKGRPDALSLIWIITAGWIFVRALFGMIRIWPGVGKSPLTPREREE
jgi:MATE family multidrug resistance protein